MSPSKKIIVAFALILSVSAVLLTDGTDASQDDCCALYHGSGHTDYQSLTDALSAAVSGDTVVVFDGCTLSADATVKAGVTLLVPYDPSGDVLDENGQGGDPSKDNLSRKKAGDSYCVTTFSISSSSTLTVYGSVAVGGVTGEKFTFDYQGHTSGKHGKIILDGKMILGSGAELRCYGYIKGSGSITAESGSAVGEPFIVTDYIGGDYAKELYEANQSPFNRYTFSNIECDLTIKYGAELTCYGELYANKKPNHTDLEIIGKAESDAFLRLSPGSEATISYDPSEYAEAEWASNIYHDVGKTTVTIKGGAEFAAISISYSGQTLDLSKVSFSIPYNFDYILSKGSYIVSSNLRLLPGASITVSDDAELAVRERLQIYDGLVEAAFKDKYYPGTELLESYGFDTKGSLIVNGSLRIGAGASVLGTIESQKEGAVITVDPQAGDYIGNVYYGVNWKSDGQNTYFSVRELATCVYDSEGNRALLTAGSSYIMAAGLSASDGFTYRCDGKTYTVKTVQLYYGVAAEPEEGDITVVADSNGYVKVDLDSKRVGKNVTMYFPGEAGLAFAWQGWSSKTDGKMEVIHSSTGGKEVFDMRFDGAEAHISKSVTIPYDTSKRVESLVCDDGFDITGPIYDAKSGTVSFISYGNSFHIEYQASGGDSLDSVIIILFVVLIVAAIAAVAFFVMRHR